MVHLVKKDAPEQATVVIGAAGSFAAISTLLGSPILGAFLLMEVAGIAGPMIGVVLLPGLLAAGIGALVFLGLDDLTGWGTFSLAVPDLPAFDSIDGYQFLWAIGIGVLGAVVGTAIHRGSQRLLPIVAPRRVLLTPGVRRRRRRRRDRLRRADRSRRRPGAVLRGGGAGPADPGREHLDRGGPGPAGRLQVGGVHAVPGQLPGRAHVPGDVHRRGRGPRSVATCRACRRSPAWPWGSGPWRWPSCACR